MTVCMHILWTHTLILPEFKKAREMTARPANLLCITCNAAPWSKIDLLSCKKHPCCKIDRQSLTPVPHWHLFHIEWCTQDTCYVSPRCFNETSKAQASELFLLYSVGLGRAPATALTYMYWFRGFTLAEAFKKLRAVRPCNPNLQAIRQATCDTLFDRGKTYPAKIIVTRPGSATDIQVSHIVRHIKLGKLPGDIF